MKYVFVKHNYKKPLVFGKYGLIQPGETLEVSEFDFEGSLAKDSMWERVEKPLSVPETLIVQEEEEAEELTSEAVKKIREKSSKK